MTLLPHAILGETTGGAAFAVDVDELVGAHLAVIANSGAGKSRSVRKLLEATHGRIQHVVLDDEGEFYTLRERFDYVIVGGANGDCPLSVASAEPLALALLENGLSAVIQTGTLDTEDGQAFVAAFLDAMRKAPQALWHPVLVVLDEAQRFAPNGEVVLSSGAVAEFAASARKRGYTLVVATGRFTMLSTKVRAHCVNWLVGRAGLDLDSRAAAAALGFRPASPEAQALKGLARGAFWAFGPALAPSPTLVQFGAVATTHLRRGQAPVPTPPAPRKLARILATLAAVAAPPDVAAPGAVNAAPPAASADAILAADRAGYERGLSEGLRRGGAFAASALGAVEATAADLVAAIAQHRARATEGTWALPQASIAAPPPRAAQDPQPPRAAPAAAERNVDGLNSAARKMLAVIDTDPPVRRSWTQVATLAGLKARGGHFNAGKRQLIDQAWIVEEGDLVRLRAPSVTTRPAETDPAALVGAWAAVLGGAAGPILRHLHGMVHDTRAGVAATLGLQPRGGHWSAAWKQLRDNDLITEDGERVRLSALFGGTR